MSPTARTQCRLKVTGHLVANVERWNPFVKRRQDLFGIFDTLALPIAKEIDLVFLHKILAIQSTSGDHHAERVKKIQQRLIEVPVLRNYFTIQVWSWRKTFRKRKDGTKSKRTAYKLRIETVE